MAAMTIAQDAAPLLGLEADPADQLIDPSGFIIIAAAVLATLLFFMLGWSRLDRAPARPRVFTPMAGIALLVVMVILQIIGFAATRALLGIELAPAGEPAMPDLAAATKIALGAYIAQSIGMVVFIHQWSKSRRPANDRRSDPATAALGGVGALVLFLPIVLMLGWLAALVVQLITGEMPDPLAHETLVLFVESDFDHWFLLMAMLVIVAAPVLEEVMYRGLLQHALRQVGLGPWTSISVTSFVFAFMHIGAVAIHALPVLFVLSLGFGWIYEKTGRLTAPILMHMLFNAFNLVLAVYFAPAT